MLFPLNAQTPQCQVFVLLNNEVVNFLRESISDDEFSEALFSTYSSPTGNVPSVCWTNRDTRELFHQLWRVLPVDEGERERLYESVVRCQDITIYFRDVDASLPQLESDALFEAMKALTIHLFSRTRNLAEAKRQSDSSIEQHYQEFLRANNNSELCPICATARLSQNRSDLVDKDQWRADYDHILCKDKYPVYGVHPGNFLPTCHICNSKAKGARNVLVDEGGERRKAFYPLPPSEESCYQFASVTVKPKSLTELRDNSWETPLAQATVQFDGAPADVAEKVDVWKEIYKVPTRVQHQIATHFFESIASSLRPRDFDDFCEQLQRFSDSMPPDYRVKEWSFWWFRVFEDLAAQNRDALEDLWALVEWKSQQSPDEDMRATFG